MRWRCCVGRSADHGRHGRIAPCCPRGPGCCRDSCARTGWPRRPRCWPGTASGDAPMALSESARSPVADQADPRIDLPVRARESTVGGIGGYTANLSVSATGLVSQPSDGSCVAQGWAPRHARWRLPGGFSYTARSTGCWPAISSMSTRFSRAGCMSCS